MREASGRWSVIRHVSKNLLPKRDDFQDVPPAVLSLATQPWWRTLAKLPNAQRLEMAKAWRDVAEACRSAHVEPVEPLRGRRPGIFLRSEVLWDHLDFVRGPWYQQFNGVTKTDHNSQLIPANFENPFGRFVSERRIDEFQFDLSDIECITHSRSDDRHFDSVDAFGVDYIEFKRFPVDEGGLQALLSHYEIRIIHSPGSDVLTLSAWDGRLTLGNAGGSHHLAGAQAVARRLGKAVPLKGRLYVRWLNAKAFSWLIHSFYVIHVNWKKEFQLLRSIARITGACFSLTLPTHVAAGQLVLFPRSAVASPAVARLFNEVGSPEVSEDLRKLLDEQARLAERCKPHLLDLCRQAMAGGRPSKDNGLAAGF